MTVRVDYRFIEQHVPPGSRVLDLGCGDGSLLERLIDEQQVDGLGIEHDERAVRNCIGRGVPVYHGDMYEGIKIFDSDAFDCVILSRTLQQALKPGEIVKQMLKVGRRCIISFPNFGHWRNRLKLLLSGRRPLTGEANLSWYNTPDLHPLTVKDFFDFCDNFQLQIIDTAFYTGNYYRIPGFLANLFADHAVLVFRGTAG